MERHGGTATVVMAILAAAAFITRGQNGMRQDIRDLRQDLRAAATERAAIRQSIQDLGERVARIEGALPFLADPAASPGQSTR